MEVLSANLWLEFLMWLGSDILIDSAHTHLQLLLPSLLWRLSASKVAQKIFGLSLPPKNWGKCNSQVANAVASACPLLTAPGPLLTVVCFWSAVCERDDNMPELVPHYASCICIYSCCCICIYSCSCICTCNCRCIPIALLSLGSSTYGSFCASQKKKQKNNNNHRLALLLLPLQHYFFCVAMWKWLRKWARKIVHTTGNLAQVSLYFRQFQTDSDPFPVWVSTSQSALPNGLLFFSPLARFRLCPHGYD